MKHANRAVCPAGNRIRKFAAFLAAAVLLSGMPVHATEEKKEDKSGTTSQLYAQAAVLMDAENGRILLEKNGSEILPMASTTKIMTCILTLEKGDLSDMASVSAYGAAQPKVHLGAIKGEYYKIEDLLYSLMLESHNDAAVIIAEHYGAKWAGMDGEACDRSKEESQSAVLAFTAKMNEKAKEIGCSNTFFVTPNGLDGTLTTKQGGNVIQLEHSTTAGDLARIMSYCITKSSAKEHFLKITREVTCQYSAYRKNSDTNEFDQISHSVSCVNHNAFLQMMDGALSGKTGFTGKAGYCYVGALQKDGKTFVVSLLACGWPNHKTWKWHDTKLLMQYGLENYERYNIYEKKEFEPVPVENGVQKMAFIEAEEKEISLLLEKNDSVEVKWTIPEHLNAPLEAGEVVGSGDYYINGKLYDSVSVKIMEKVLEITYQYCLRIVIGQWML